MGCLDAALKAQLCSPHLLLLQRVVQRGWLQSSYCLLRFTGQGATVGRSQRTGRLRGAHRQVSFSVPFAVMMLAPSWIAPGSLDISLSFREWRRNMGMVCLLPLALVIPLWAVAATLQSRGVWKANPAAPCKEETGSISSSSDLYSRLCNSSWLDLCHSCRAGMFPLFFPSVSHGLYCSTVPSPSAGLICP